MCTKFINIPQPINVPMGTCEAVGIHKHQIHFLHHFVCRPFYVYHFLFHSFFHVATHHKTRFKRERDSRDLLKVRRDSNIFVHGLQNSRLSNPIHMLLFNICPFHLLCLKNGLIIQLHSQT